MASERDWADAYLAQAREDLRAAKKLGGEAPSVFCMLMQMTFEKIAKAALLRSSQISLHGATTSHRAASQLVKILKRNRKHLKILGGGRAFEWKDVLPLVTELEHAHPALAKGNKPRLEYPWEAPDRSIRWPARDLPIVNRMRNSRELSALRLLKFADRLFGEFDSLFP